MARRGIDALVRAQRVLATAARCREVSTSASKASSVAAGPTARTTSLATGAAGAAQALQWRAQSKSPFYNSALYTTSAAELLSVIDEGNQAEVEAMYDSWSASYDEEIQQFGYTAPGVAAQLLSERLRARRGPTPQILDVGCGTGLVGAALARLSVGQVTGVDISEASIQRATETGAYRAFVKHDITLPRFPFQSHFDGIVCIGATTYVPNPQALLSEFARLLKPGGVAIFTVNSNYARQHKIKPKSPVFQKTGLRVLEVVEGEAYLPLHADYGDTVKVDYYACTAAAAAHRPHW